MKLVVIFACFCTIYVKYYFYMENIANCQENICKNSEIKLVLCTDVSRHKLLTPFAH